MELVASIEAQLDAETRTVDVVKNRILDKGRAHLIDNIKLLQEEHSRRRNVLENATTEVHDLYKLLPEHDYDKMNELKHAQKRYDNRLDEIKRCELVASQLQALKSSLSEQLTLFKKTELTQLTELESRIQSFEQYFGFRLEIQNSCVKVVFDVGVALIDLNKFQYIRFNGREVKIMSENVTFLQAVCLAYTLLSEW